MNFFSLDSPFARFLHLVGDIVTMHLLWLVCSLPVVTVGASTTALYYCCMKRIRTNEGYVWRNFFTAFRQNFRQSTVIWLILLVIGGLLAVDLGIGMQVGGALGKFMLISCSVFIIPYLLVCIYIFPILAKFENSIRDNLKNALLMPFQSLHYSLLLLFVLATFVLLSVAFPPFGGLLIACGAGLYGYITGGIFVQLFRRYVPDEAEGEAGLRQ